MPQGQSSSDSLATTSFLRQGGCYFRIEILRAGETSPDEITDLTFPAFIDSINDSFSPTWGTYNDMGRGDPKVMYESFSRSIQISFKVVGLYRDQQPTPALMFQQLNQLSRAVTPNYVDGRGFVGRFIRFSLARLWLNEYGYLESLTVNIDNNTPWKTTRDGQGEYPIVAQVDMTIKWIGNMRPDSSNPNMVNYNDQISGDLFTMAELRDSPNGTV